MSFNDDSSYQLHGVKGCQKYDKLQIFTVFNNFSEDGYCYSSPFFLYPHNGLKNNLVQKLNYSIPSSNMTIRYLLPLLKRKLTPRLIIFSFGSTLSVGVARRRHRANSGRRMPKKL